MVCRHHGESGSSADRYTVSSGIFSRMIGWLSPKWSLFLQLVGGVGVVMGSMTGTYIFGLTWLISRRSCAHALRPSLQPSITPAKTTSGRIVLSGAFQVLVVGELRLPFPTLIILQLSVLYSSAASGSQGRATSSKYSSPSSETMPNDWRITPFSSSKPL